jgi:DNA-binding protein H-NS
MSNELQTIEQQIAQLQAKKQEILNSKRNTALEETRNNVRLYGFTSAELGLGKSAAQVTEKPKAAAKYVNPANTTQTWAGGKGPIPKWVKEHEARGGSRESLLIK